MCLDGCSHRAQAHPVLQGWTETRFSQGFPRESDALQSITSGGAGDKKRCSHCVNAHNEDALIPLPDVGYGPCMRCPGDGGTMECTNGFFVDAVPGESGAVEWEVAQAQCPAQSCHLGAGVCSEWCVAGARWAGASSQTVNMAKQAALSAVLLAARHEKITPVKQ